MGAWRLAPFRGQSDCSMSTKKAKVESAAALQAVKKSA